MSRKRLRAAPTREEGSVDECTMLDVSRCMARIKKDGVGVQCSQRRVLNQDLCAQHQAFLKAKGALRHGRMDSGFCAHSSAERVQGIRTIHQPLMPALPPIASKEDASRIVECMKNATEKTRIATLMSLDRTPRHHLSWFVFCGGLFVLEKWIRAYLECRFACLTVLSQVPLGSRDISLVRPVVLEAQCDQRKEVRKKAQDVLAAWDKIGLAQQSMPQSAKRPNPSEPVLAAKRPKVP